ncbi:MAG: hypothetical protein NTW38_07360 [Candidatus Aminicenantes bacterium]|nr:hypothetical protein [Candidatus Aminicenantes bacterium]
MGRTIFAIVHFGLFIGLVVYGVVLLVRGETDKGLTILGIVGLYYALVLHKAVLAEIERKRRLKKSDNPRSTK